MSLRIPGFILAAVLLVGYRLIKPRTQASGVPDRWNLPTLLLASALTLFAELALIRWVATEIRVFAYVKNLALLLCFLGFGLGCALARQRPRWQTAATALLGLIVIVRLPWRGPQIMESLSQYLGAAQDVRDMGHRHSARHHWLSTGRGGHCHSALTHHLHFHSHRTNRKPPDRTRPAPALWLLLESSRQSGRHPRILCRVVAGSASGSMVHYRFGGHGAAAIQSERYHPARRRRLARGAPAHRSLHSAPLQPLDSLPADRTRG